MDEETTLPNEEVLDADIRADDTPEPVKGIEHLTVEDVMEDSFMKYSMSVMV